MDERKNRVREEKAVLFGAETAIGGGAENAALARAHRDRQARLTPAQREELEQRIVKRFARVCGLPADGTRPPRSAADLVEHIAGELANPTAQQLASIEAARAALAAAAAVQPADRPRVARDELSKASHLGDVIEDTGLGEVATALGVEAALSAGWRPTHRRRYPNGLIELVEMRGPGLACYDADELRAAGGDEALRTKYGDLRGAVVRLDKGVDPVDAAWACVWECVLERRARAELRTSPVRAS